MKVLGSWLREFAPFEGDPVALAEQMSDLGMAVESIELLGDELEGIVVAEVLSLRPHPDADRIQLVEVDTGDGEALQICCGAFNMSVGDRVPLATLGAVMPSGMKIERRKMRGEWSNGMLCSSAELGFDENHGGILILPGDLELGTQIEEALGIENDVLFDLEINPNRPDAMSVAGVARDLAARLRLPFRIPDPTPDELGDAIGDSVGVEIVDRDLCGRFHVRVLEGVEVGQSPRWMAARLTAAGMRPINSVVDVSNYVMLELGQPNHTYDLAKLARTAEGKAVLRVRRAAPGEKIITLDDVERTLSPDDGVIADADDVAVGIAGVMGGASTEIDDASTSVLLEMAWWDPMTIARSSQRLGLRSEASMRFERGCDPEIVELAARRFAQLLSPSTLRPGAVDERGNVPDRSAIVVRTSRVNSMLGTGLSDQAIAEQLVPIGFGVEPGKAAGQQMVTIPSFRPDTVTETDVIEEIARHYGYSNIAKTRSASARVGSLSTRQREIRVIRMALVGAGLDEAMPMPLLAPDDCRKAGLAADAVTLTNPLTSEESVLRRSLRPGLLRAVAFNESHRSQGVSLFEIGTVFDPPGPGETLPVEHQRITALLAGAEVVAAIETWAAVADAVALMDWRLDQKALDGLHPGRGAQILSGGDSLGVVGELHPDVLAAFGVSERVVVVDIDLDTLLAQPHGEHRYHTVSRFPSSDIDLSFEVDESIPAGHVAHIIAGAAGELLVDLELFDVYRGTTMTGSKRGLTYSLRLQATDRTLTDDEVGRIRSRVIAAVQEAHGANLRG